MRRTRNNDLPKHATRIWALAYVCAMALLCGAAGAQQTPAETAPPPAPALVPGRMGMVAPAAALAVDTKAEPTAAPKAPAKRMLPGRMGPHEATPADLIALSEGKPGDPKHEGVTVHGHWTIDIKNPDGTQAQHHEFENSLSDAGGELLVGLLSGQLVAGNYMILLGPGNTSPCQSPSPASTPYCGIVQSTTTTPATAYCNAYYCAPGLAVTANYSFATFTYTLTLAGSIVANQTGSIAGVYSIMGACGANGYAPAQGTPTQTATIGPAACLTATTANVLSSVLTYTGITPINVANGQTITVSVVISFS